jgi:hypothetical protein
MEEGLDALRSDDPRKRAFRLAIATVTEYGGVEMKWKYPGWGCTEEDISQILDDSSPALFDPETAFARHVQELKRIIDPPDVFNEAQSMIKKLESQEPVQDEAPWSYFLCDSAGDNRRMEDRQWTPLRKPSDFGTMNHLAKQQKKVPVLLRVRRSLFSFSPRSCPRS